MAAQSKMIVMQGMFISVFCNNTQNSFDRVDLSIYFEYILSEFIAVEIILMILSFERKKFKNK